jgi:L-iditol 2-dehydrogenase
LKSVLLKSIPGKGRLEAVVIEIPEPAAGPGDIVIEMRTCGLCGTDIEKIRGEYTASMPVIGHEAVGVVSAVGEGVLEVEEGDRVFPHHHVPCYECRYCKRGSETMCGDYKTSNLDPGGFSELFRVPAWNVKHGGVLQVPPQVTDEEASMIEPVACCGRAISRCGVVADDSVLIVGAGPVGLSHALLLGSMGSQTMVTDIVEPRLRFAERMGVGRVVDASRADVPREAKEWTGGRGADVVIVASGSQKAVTQALKSVRRGGVVCLFGIPVKGSMLECRLSDIYNSDIAIVPSYGAAESDTAKALKIIAARDVDFRPLITHRFPLEEFNRGVEVATQGQAMKVVITPQ